MGNKTVQAIVNDTSVPLNYELQNNDIVKIRTNPNGTPSKEWLNFVKTSHARNKIKAYFSKQDKEIYTEKGRTILQNELRKKKLSFDEVLSSENVKKICKDLKLDSLEDIYFSIGSLRYTATYIISLTTEDKKDVQDVLIEKVLSNHPSEQKNRTSDILVGGQSNILANLAKCCKPVLGDDIKGFITKGEGVSVHRANCPNIEGKTERFVDVSWNDIGGFYYTGVRVETDIQKNYLLDIISKATAKNLYIDSFKTRNDQTITYYDIIVKVKNKDQLDDFITSLYSYKFVLKAERI